MERKTHGAPSHERKNTDRYILGLVPRFCPHVRKHIPLVAQR